MTALWILVSGAAVAGTVDVTTGADAGPGSFRAAIEAANGDAGIHTVRFARGLPVALEAPVLYTGSQALRLEGRGAQVAGGAAAPGAIWDAGLFAASGGADIEIDGLSFRDSFNNGIGIFLPGTAVGVVRVELHDVVIERSRFHGLYVDGQASAAFDTDGRSHPDCRDPHPVDSAAGISLLVTDAEIRDNGTLAGGFDAGAQAPGQAALSGCPADFDGIRVDEGGAGGIEATLRGVRIEGNLADGVEYDERGDGDVVAITVEATLRDNGETGTPDLDDGFDIDEADDGEVVAVFRSVTVVDSRDEGIDIDEAGPGSVFVDVVESVASRNEDQGVKIVESGPGHLVVRIAGSEVNGSLSQHGIALAEDDAGDLDARLVGSRVAGNDAAAVEAAQTSPGAGRLLVVGSDLRGNPGGAFGDLRGVAASETRSRTAGQGDPQSPPRPSRAPWASM